MLHRDELIAGEVGVDLAEVEGALVADLAAVARDGEALHGQRADRAEVTLGGQ